MKTTWRSGNHITLLENGDAYYPAVFDAINQAKKQVLLETFIWFDDDVGQALHQVLLAAAQRGVQVEVLMDGYGSPDLSETFISTLTQAGVVVRYYDPSPLFLGMRTNLFRRMHRKIVVIDGELAFVGGINYSAEHLTNYGPEAKQDYAVAIRGPVVSDIQQFVIDNLPESTRTRRWRWRRYRAQDQNQAGEAQALFIWRDNNHHPDDIERYYLRMLARARREVIIANAYFFPGYRLLHAMRNAARRGVSVKLILQGEPDIPVVKTAARLLYPYLLKAGVHIYEYQQRPLHGKVAVMDSHWATVGSSNLDPLSLSLNLEANLVIHDREFNQTLRDNLMKLISHSTEQTQADRVLLPGPRWWGLTCSVLAFHFVRHFPAMVGWLPAHTPRITRVPPPVQPELEQQDQHVTTDSGGQ